MALETQGVAMSVFADVDGRVSHDLKANRAFEKVFHPALDLRLVGGLTHFLGPNDLFGRSFLPRIEGAF